MDKRDLGVGPHLEWREKEGGWDIAGYASPILLPCRVPHCCHVGVLFPYCLFRKPWHANYIPFPLRPSQPHPNLNRLGGVWHALSVAFMKGHAAFWA